MIAKIRLSAKINLICKYYRSSVVPPEEHASVSYRTSRVTTGVLLRAAAKVVELESLRRIPKTRLKELWIQGVLLGFLENRIGYMELEYPAKNGRIDFYHKGNPPSAIELAVVVGKWIYQHSPRINNSEMKKLRSLCNPKKIRRFLLLIDLKSKTPLKKDKLKEDYTSYFKRKGNSKITVVYVHKDDKFAFVC